MATLSEKLENCEVCAVGKAKYTCPRCEVRTCTLTCVNIHKKELACDGIRDKTKFIPLHEFTDLDLLSDYRLLEQVGRSVDQLERDHLRKSTRLDKLPSNYDYNHNSGYTRWTLFKTSRYQPLHRLRLAVYQRGIKLEFMPENFTRRRENTMFFDWKKNELFWRIEWIFPQAENAKWITKRVSESTRLSDAVLNILDPLDSADENSPKDDANTRDILQGRLQYYRAAYLTGIKIYLKAEKVRKSNSRFHELDLALTLSENFAKKTIIEFPTVHVVLKDHTDMYEMVDSDEEETMVERPIGKLSRNSRDGRREKLGVKKEPINYFFDAELSDSDNDDAKKRGNVDVLQYTSNW